MARGSFPKAVSVQQCRSLAAVEQMRSQADVARKL